MKRDPRKKRPSFTNPLGLKKSSKPRRPVAADRFSKDSFKKLPAQPWKKAFWQRFWHKRSFHLNWRKILIGLAILVGLFVITTASLFAYFVRDLPNPKKIADRPIAQSTQILDRNGKNLYNIHGEENRTVVTGDDISPFSKEATISVEDAGFYKEHGFSIRGITRAFLAHLPIVKHFFPAGELGGGGSTITQQYIKNALLTDDPSITRKLQELILSIEIERMYSKDEILTGYLNEIPYGGSAYGIESAARTYFDKDAKDLTLSEAATLAAIPQSPTTYSPYGNNTDLLFARKNYVLDRMVRTGYITQAQADDAKKTAPTEANPSFRQQTDLIAPHFVFYVRQQLIDFLGGDPQIAEKELDSGGYKVTTSLDLDTQNLAQQIISDMGPTQVKKYGASNASLTAVDPKTGEVLAMVGSIDYNNSKSGNTNFANVQLQPGSTFKPIVYATAFGPNNHYAPSSVTYDLTTDFGGGYIPQDYDLKNRGPVTDRMALDGSLNIPAVKNLYLAGVKNSIDTAKKLGIDTLTDDPNSYGLSLVLGSGGVTEVEMANAFATFANGGMHNTLRPILKIEKGGAIVKDFTKEQPTKALEPEVAYEINNILSDNSSRAFIFGSNSSLTLGPDRPVAAKSGTTENDRDAWTIGYTPSIAVAVWVGNNEPNKTMVAGADGSYVAAPIWNKFMKQYLTGKPVEQFTRPSTIKDVTVDKLSGKLPTDQTPDNDKVTDIFAPWQIPKDNDDVHVKVKIDKATGKLATSLTPADQIEEQTFFNVHSEVPDNPNWEGPVQAWAKANGGGTSPPTDTDDVHTQQNQPTISITSPTDGSVVNGNFTITAAPGGPQPITKVEFFVNNVSIGVVTQAPWSITYSSSSLAAGSQVIQAIATNNLELTQTAQVTVSTSKDSVAPGSVSNLNADAANSQHLNHPIHLSWTNPVDTDVVSANIYQSTTADPSDLGTLAKTVTIGPGGSGSADIDVSGLQAGKTYYYIVRPVDSSGNINTSTTKVSAKVIP